MLFIYSLLSDETLHWSPFLHEASTEFQFTISSLWDGVCVCAVAQMNKQGLSYSFLKFESEQSLAMDSELMIQEGTRKQMEGGQNGCGSPSIGALWIFGVLQFEEGRAGAGACRKTKELWGRTCRPWMPNMSSWRLPQVGSLRLGCSAASFLDSQETFINIHNGLLIWSNLSEPLLLTKRARLAWKWVDLFKLTHFTSLILHCDDFW